jgi:RNA polymerase sigma-70 factor (ECF subfamily)
MHVVSNKMHQMDLDLLLKDCLKRKPAAQRELYDLFAPSMLGLCFRYTKSMSDAEEVLQEGFIKVFERLKQYRSDGEFGGWVRTIMVNTALNFLKANKRYRQDLLFEEMPLHAVSNDNPEVLLQAKELAMLVRQLPTGFQTIFNLHAVEGFKHTEIAVMLGISEGTSRSQYARARTLLIEWIEKKSETKENYGIK